MYVCMLYVRQRRYVLANKIAWLCFADFADACRVDITSAKSLDQSLLLPRKLEIKSIGRGKMMVEFFSAEMELSVCKNKNIAIIR